MLQSRLFTKARKEAPSDEVSKNAKLLIQAGYIHKEMAGVYDFLPLGNRVLRKISNIIREEMDKVGGQEVLMTTLQDPESWKKSGRWDDEVVDDWFKTELKNGSELGLGFTHEEALTKLLIDHVGSYKDLPFYPYQIQTKFRNELRAKSGIMRGREFIMKDMYSFTKDTSETDDFHEKVKDAYKNIFQRVGIGEQTYLTISSGGSFSKYSYEFQTLSEAGEDTILLSSDKKVSVNKDDYGPELEKDFGLEGMEFTEHKSIEVGDIYKLGTKYSEALGLKYKNSDGKEVLVDMGSYGIGVSRLVGAVTEVMADDKGLVWPVSIAPFKIHLVEIAGKEGSGVRTEAEKIYAHLINEGYEVLFDDREVSAGQKLSESDLLGIPYRVVVSGRTIEKGKYELTNRISGETKDVSIEEISKL